MSESRNEETLSNDDNEIKRNTHIDISGDIDNKDNENDSYLADKDLNSTLEDIKEKKQKEREDKLADMMGHYHKKYSNPISPISSENDNNNNNIEEITDKYTTTTTSSSHKRSLSATKKKDELAEQMKKYHDQFGNIRSSVNSILSSPSSNSSHSSYSSLTNSPTLTRNNNKNNNNNNNSSDNNINQTTPPPELNLLTEKETTTTTTTTTAITTSFNENKQINTSYQEKEEKEKEQQKETQTKVNFQEILYFEHENIPLLTNVGFKTLKSIEMDAMKCSESVISLTKSLNYSLQMMTKMSVELFHAYKISNESLCHSLGNSTRETEIMINKCIELNEQTKSIHNLHYRIKLIKENINRFEVIILNMMKQLSVPQK